jgi:hypothetical protein
VSDANGVIVAPVTPADREAVLVIDDCEYHLLLGPTPPADTVTGLLIRFADLGYWGEELVQSFDDLDLKVAIQRFETDHGMPQTGQVTPELFRKVTELHYAWSARHAPHDAASADGVR